MTEAIWNDLATHRADTRERTMRELFAADPGRFERFSARLDDLLLDFSKTHLTAETLALLLSLVDAAGVAAKREAMFSGTAINTTEGRAVLHTALRAATEGAPAGAEIADEVAASRERLYGFAEAVRSGATAASDGAPFTDVVNIGIGGSDLGPAMAVRALGPYHDGPRCHFVSNVDGADIADTLARLDPARTLFIVASKTFTTVETMTNARTARAWIACHLGEAAVGDHFVAVSTALDKVGKFGIAAERTFGFWDWVGGRYSLWSAIGLPIVIAVGAARFDEFLAGARAVDEHFRTAPPAENLPMLLGLVGIWHRNVCGFPTRAVLPYDQRLGRLPAYFQQLDMESNGKRVKLDGTAVTRATGPVVWGEPGTNGQHAFYQLIHQGTDVVPCEFLIAAESHEGPEMAEHQALLIANCLAQSEALMKGRTLDEARALLAAAGHDAAAVEALAPHKVFPGNRPTVTIAYRTLDPFTLGRIIALYEHRVFVEGAIWGINSFDQWGVELGKELATALLPVVQGREPVGGRDASTAGLVGHIAALKG